MTKSNQKGIETRKTNHAYQYKYDNRNRSMTKSNVRHSQGYRRNQNNKVYFRGPNGWFYEIHDHQNHGASQSNEKASRVASQQKQ